MIAISVSFTIMHTHISKLSKLCHFGSKTVITGEGYSSAKTVYDYQIALATYLRIDVNEGKGVCHWKMLVYIRIIMKKTKRFKKLPA